MQAVRQQKRFPGTCYRKGSRQWQCGSLDALPVFSEVRETAAVLTLLHPAAAQQENCTHVRLARHETTSQSDCRLPCRWKALEPPNTKPAPIADAPTARRGIG